MIKIYTDKSYLTPENRTIVFPLLFDVFYTKNPRANDIFLLVDALILADIVIVPIAINYYFKANKTEELNHFVDAALALNKPVWCYSAGDFGITFRKEVIHFRLSGYKTKMQANEFILPNFINDPYETIFTENWAALPKNNLPTIGFVGNASNSFLKFTKEFLNFLKSEINKFFNKSFGDATFFYPSAKKRFQILNQLSKNPQIKTNFIFRNKYRASNNNKAQTTLEFYQNMQSNLYVFCLRGVGNFSVRFYEALISGRIPVLIDTDLQLPLENLIDWKKHIILVNKNNFADKLIEFHQQKTNQELIEIQENNRNLALNGLNRITFFEKFYTLHP